MVCDLFALYLRSTVYKPLWLTCIAYNQIMKNLVKGFRILFNFLFRRLSLP